MHKDMLREITPAEGWDEVWNSDVTRSSQKPGQGCVVSNFNIFFYQFFIFKIQLWANNN